MRKFPKFVRLSPYIFDVVHVIFRLMYAISANLRHYNGLNKDMAVKGFKLFMILPTRRARKYRGTAIFAVGLAMRTLTGKRPTSTTSPFASVSPFAADVEGIESVGAVGEMFMRCIPG